MMKSQDAATFRELDADERNSVSGGGGNVTVDVTNGNLLIHGDSADNSVSQSRAKMWVWDADFVTKYA